MVHFGEFFKHWSLRSNSVTRQVNFHRTKIGTKCQNWNTTFLSDFQTKCRVCAKSKTFSNSYATFCWFSNNVFLLKNATEFKIDRRTVNYKSQEGRKVQLFLIRKANKPKNMQFNFISKVLNFLFLLIQRDHFWFSHNLASENGHHDVYRLNGASIIFSILTE